MGIQMASLKSKSGNMCSQGENRREGNRILGAGAFGYHSDCLPVSPYKSRTICITYVVYVKIKHCSGPAVPNSVSKSLWALPKQHHIIILVLPQSVLLQHGTQKTNALCNSVSFCTNNENWGGVGVKEKENSEVDITEGKQPRDKVLESRFLNSGHWGYFLCQCLVGVKRMRMNLSVRVNKTASGSQRTFVKFQRGLEHCLLWELRTNPVCCCGY